MTPARLRAILDAYGADPARWPADERDAALRLLAHSAEARRHHDVAARLDDALDAAPSEVASPALAGRVLRAAPGPRKLRIVGLIAAAPLAAAAGLVFWLVSTRAPAPRPLSENEIVALGVYETPTDALIASTETDLVEEAPALGCSPDELGCIDLDLPESDDSSRRDIMGRIRA
jgi:hypothetical protein